MGVAMTIDHVAKETDVRCYGDGCWVMVAVGTRCCCALTPCW